MTLTIVSGGQTGVDRGAFETAIRLGLDFGGWAPKGFRAEDGRIPEVYARRMRESLDEGYALRTRLNVQDSDATLILSWSSSPEKAGGGTWFTEKACRQQGKQCVHLRLPRAGEEHPPEVQDGVLKWLRLWKVGVLNIGGPRESKCPGIQAATIACLRWLLEPLAVEAVRRTGHLLGELLDREIAAANAAADRRERCLDAHGYGCDRAECGRAPLTPGDLILDANGDVAAADRPALRELIKHESSRGAVLLDVGDDLAPLDPVDSDAPAATFSNPPEGLDERARRQLDASIREAEHDARGTERPPRPGEFDRCDCPSHRDQDGNVTRRPEPPAPGDQTA